MATTTDKFKISHEDHLDGIVNRVYESWGTSQVVDSWMEKYPRWAHLGRKIFRDAARVSNPRSNKFSTEYRKIYERTLAHYREERRALLEATASKASSAISQIVESVRSNVTNVPIDNAHDLLAVSRSIYPVKDIAHHEAAKLTDEHHRSISPSNQRPAIDRLRRHRRLDRGNKKSEG